jgi:hypothetical protein
MRTGRALLTAAEEESAPVYQDTATAKEGGRVTPAPFVPAYYVTR